MLKPAITIIIPTYNSERSLSKAIQSILAQSLKDFEILIIDNCSADNTVSLAQSFRDGRIRVYSEKDTGIYEAMNKGIRLARGEWLLFLGSDDSLYSSNILYEIQKELNGFDVVYGNVFSQRYNDKYDGEFTKEKIYEKNICHQSIFFKKSLFKKTGFFNPKYKTHADWDHNLKWFLSEKVRKKHVPLIVANYADGGFSSLNPEVFFSDIKPWKFSVLVKKEIKFSDRLKIVRTEYNKAVHQKRRRDALMILFQAPSFLL